MERAARGREEEVANYLHGALKRGLDFAGAEIFAIPKAKGLRPLSALSFLERSLYRALTQPLKDELSLPERSYDNYLAFTKGPLEVEGVTHVVSADVTSFYQYIDHDLLHEEIVNQTGHAGIADSIVAVLHGVTQRRVGLPQLYDPSDWLSEVLIDRVERNMLREGFFTFRFNDDFRVACRSWAEAQEAILQLDRELRSIGLVLNDEKTYTQAMSTYEEWNEAPERAWAEIAEQLGLDIRDPDWEAISVYARAISPLVGEEVEGDPDNEEDQAEDEAERALWIEAADKALEIWLRGKSGLESDPLQQSIERRLLRQGLRILTTARATEGLDHCKTILTTEQHLSHLVGRYMAAAARVDPDEVLGRISDWVSEGFYISDWQRLWLMEPLLLVEAIPPAIGDWMRENLSSSSSVLRGRTLSVLVYKGVIEPQAAVVEIDSLADSPAKDLTAAVASVLKEGRLVDSLKSDFLSRLVVGFAGS